MTTTTITDEMREQRKAICAQVAKMEADGASIIDLARTFPLMGPVAIKSATDALWAHGLISLDTGEIRQGAAVYTITKRGLCALGKIPAGNWHVDQETNPCH